METDQRVSVWRGWYGERAKIKIWKKNSFLFIYERKILLFNPKFLYKFTPYYIKKHRKNIFVSFILLYSLMNSM